MQVIYSVKQVLFSNNAVITQNREGIMSNNNAGNIYSKAGASSNNSINTDLIRINFD